MGPVMRIFDTISHASAFTSHGWPPASSERRVSASSENICPVAAACCSTSARTSASLNVPSVSDSSFTLNGLAVPSRFASPPLAVL